jgi:hypothetical protein
MDKHTNHVNEEYPKGIKKNQCIGPCYPPGSTILHPITLQIVSSNKSSNKLFCPIQPWRDKLGRTHVVDECTKVTSSASVNEDIEKNFIIPKISFDPAKFLVLYYSIRSLDEVVIWYNNNATVPYNTIKRIMDCALKVYGEEELHEKPASDFMIEFTKFMILEYWFDKYLIKLSPFISVVENKINNVHTLVVNQEILEDSKQKTFDIKQKLFIKKKVEELLTTLLVRRILRKFYEQYKDTWTSMNSHLIKLSKIAFYFVKRKLLQK